MDETSKYLNVEKDILKTFKRLAMLVIELIRLTINVRFVENIPKHFISYNSVIVTKIWKYY